ncbi:MAG TPA: hypothetical protein VGM56_24855 [Byssovorax sp.]|jgi:hypothetical protein
MGTLSVGAIAIASRRANAVGAVRLTCERDGLYVELVRAGPFSRGFAPGAIAEHVWFRAPYSAVRGLVRERRALHLALDPEVVSPHSRFSLARFSNDPASALAGAYAARARARVASLFLPFAAAAAAAAMTPEALAGGVVGRASFALLVGALSFALLRELVAWRTFGGPSSDALRDAFERELARRLGLAPAHVEVPVDLDGLDADEIDAEPARAFPRSLALAGVVAAIAVAAIGVFTRTLSLAPQKEPPLAEAAHVRPTPPLPAEPTSAEDAPPTLPRCTCARADAVAWQRGLPIVAVFAFPTSEDGAAVKPVVDRRGRGRYEFEVAAVNESNQPARDVRVTLTFARRNKRGERVGATDRGLFWEGALAPGRAVKWHVKAPGTEMKLEASYAGGALDPDHEAAGHGLADAHLEPAPADAAFQLTRSRWRAVRREGAKLLAYARDPRAAAAIEALRSNASPADAAGLDDLARAAADLYACDVAIDADASEARGSQTASACVFNGSTRTATGLALVDLASRASFPIGSIVPAHEGVRVAWPSAKPPGAVDVLSAR